MRVLTYSISDGIIVNLLTGFSFLRSLISRMRGFWMSGKSFGVDQNMGFEVGFVGSAVIHLGKPDVSGWRDIASSNVKLPSRRARVTGRAKPIVSEKSVLGKTFKFSLSRVSVLGDGLVSPGFLLVLEFRGFGKYCGQFPVAWMKESKD